MKIITKQTAVFSFNELSTDAQQKAIEKECEVLSENWQADLCIESCNEWLDMLGFSDTKIYYSGFWSQGDGACFIGDYAFKKDTVEKITTEFPKFTQLQDVAKRLQELQEKIDYSLSATISHCGRYYHENSMEFSIDMEDFNCEVEEDFIIICRKLACMIYNYIYECYESETSAEYAKECILGNELEYLEDGSVYY